jgi:hypothetical protein
VVQVDRLATCVPILLSDAVMTGQAMQINNCQSTKLKNIYSERT